VGQIRRRWLLIGIGALLTLPLADARAEGPRPVRIGVLLPVSRAESIWPELLPPQLHKLGWVEGQNLVIEWRSTERRPERLPSLAAELVDQNVQVIVAIGDAEAVAVRRATRSIPIVMVLAADPVNRGLAANLTRPGGNVSGVMFGELALAWKSIEILKEMLPQLQRLGIIYAKDRHNINWVQVEASLRQRGIELFPFPVTNSTDLQVALDTAKRKQVDALKVFTGGAVSGEQVRAFSVANRIPTDWVISTDVDRGGLMSYAPTYSENAARAAVMIDKILRGASTADLPFEYPTRYELVVNLAAAKQLGITVPQSILLRASRVIE
jgi:putative ABC transport system substrate-binding protein